MLRGTEEGRRFLLDLGDALRRLTDPNVMQQTAARRVGEHLRVARTAFAERLPGGRIIRVAGDWCKPGASSVVGEYGVEDFGTLFTRPLREGRVSVIEDAGHDPCVDAARYADARGALHTRSAITYALVQDERLVGAFFVHEEATRHWADEEIQLVCEVGERTWEAVQRARAEAAQRTSEAQLRRRTAWLEGQNRAFQSAVNDAPLAVTLGILIRSATEQIDPRARCGFYLANDAGTELHHLTGMPDSYARCVDGFPIGADSFACGLAFSSRAPVITPDVREEPRWAPWLWLAEKFEYQGIWSFPVETSPGKAVGTFAFYFPEPRAPQPEDLELARTLTRTASIIIAQHRSRAQLAAELEDTQRLREISLELVQQDRTEILYPKILAAAIGIMRAQYASLHQLPAECGDVDELRLLAAHGFASEDDRFWARSGTDPASTCREALRTGRRVIVADIATSKLMQDSADRAQCRRLGIRALQSTPLLSREGKLLGVLSTHWSQPCAPTERDLHLLDVVARQAADLLERDATSRRLQENDARQTFLLELTDALRPLTDIEAIHTTTARMLAGRLGISRVVYHEIQGADLIVREDWIHAASSVRGRGALEERAHARSGRSERIVVNDVTAESGLASSLPSYAATGVAAYAAICLIEAGHCVGALTLSNEAPRRWSDAELALAEEVAERTRSALQRARVEAALRTSEERFRSFAEASGDTLWIMDARHKRLEYVSPAYETTWGELRDDMATGSSFWADRLHPDDLPNAAQKLRRLRNGERFKLEYRIIRRDGTLRYIQDTGFPIYENGSLRRIAGIAQDITQHHIAQQALARSERRARTLMEGVPQLVWRAADAGSWTWASPQWTGFTGQQEVESHGAGWLTALHPDDREAVLAAWRRAQATGGFDIEHRIRRRDGVFLWFSTRATPVQDDAGRIVEWLGASADIDALRQAQERHRVLLAELQHRTRNLIAVVGALVNKTTEGAASLEEFTQQFAERLSALSRVQHLLSHRAAGQRVSFDELLRSELSAHGANGNQGGRVTLEGLSGVPLRRVAVTDAS